MKKIIKYFIPFIMGVFFLSLNFCNFNVTDIDHILSKAQELIYSNPDSAYHLLESIQNPLKLKDKYLSYYTLLYMQVREDNYDIPADTLIFEARDYFISHKKETEYAFAEFFCGKIYLEDKKYEEAIYSFLIAETEAQKLKNKYLEGLASLYIGRTFYNQFLFKEAISRFEKSASLFAILPQNYNNEISAYKLIANCFFLLKDIDNALLYYDKALQRAIQYKDVKEISNIKQNIGLVFSKTDQYEKAKQEFFEILQISTDPKSKHAAYLALSCVFENENKNDSAFYYADLSLEIIEKENDLNILGSTYRIMSRIEEKRNDFEKALEYYRLYSHYYSLFQKGKENANLLELQMKYDFELLNGTNDRLLIEKQKIIIIGTVLILIILFVSFLLYLKNLKNKQTLSETKRTIYELKEMANKTDNSIRKVLIERFNIVKKVSLLEGYLREDERKQGKEILRKINMIIYEQDDFDWNTMYKSMNELYKGYFDKVKSVFPDFNDTEFKICCLTMAGLNTTEISIILKLKQNTIHIKKTYIRKKLGLSNYGDISQAIHEKISLQKILYKDFVRDAINF